MNEQKYSEIITWLQTKGQTLYGHHFKIIENDRRIIFKLIAYFKKYELTCFKYNLNLNKGIIINLPVVCVKT